MKSTILAAWPKGYFVCVATNNLSFDSESAARSYMARYCGTGRAIKRIYMCPKCEGFHVESEENDENGKRPQTLRLPASAIATGRRLSAEDTKKYASQ